VTAGQSAQVGRLVLDGRRREARRSARNPNLRVQYFFTVRKGGAHYPVYLCRFKSIDINASFRYEDNKMVRSPLGKGKLVNNKNYESIAHNKTLLCEAPQHPLFIDLLECRHLQYIICCTTWNLHRYEGTYI
jgi:hypothetical protein